MPGSRSNRDAPYASAPPPPGMRSSACDGVSHSLFLGPAPLSGPRQTCHPRRQGLRQGRLRAVHHSGHRGPPGAAGLQGRRNRFDGFGDICQWIDSIFDSIKDQLGLAHHGPRTLDGCYARVSSKLLALSARIWQNCKIHESRKGSPIHYAH